MYSLWDYIKEASRKSYNKKDWGRKMHDPNTTEEEKQELVKMLEEAGGYENLPD